MTLEFKNRKEAVFATVDRLKDLGLDRESVDCQPVRQAIKTSGVIIVDSKRHRVFTFDDDAPMSAALNIVFTDKL